MPLDIIRADIVNMRVDAIVNAANTRLREGVGVCGAIFSCAGNELKEECENIGGCRPGQAVITHSHGLPAKFIIHTAGPVWQGGMRGEEEVLASCYRESLQLAASHKFKSIAFPLISTGALGFPRELALRIAVDAIGEFLLESDMNVRLVIFDRESVRMTEKLFSPIKQYIDDHYAADHGHQQARRRGARFERQTPARLKAQYSLNEQNADFFQGKPEEIRYSHAPRALEDEALVPAAPPARMAGKPARDLASLMREQHETFSQSLMRLIDLKGFKDTDVYKRANIDRRLFSKIRSQKDYQPKKQTALALAVALRLNLDETRDLIGKAGYALTESSRSDLIVAYFIQIGEYNIFRINAVLFEYDEAALSA